MTALDQALQKEAKIKAQLEAMEKTWENYDGNNPNKYLSDLSILRSELRTSRYTISTLTQEGINGRRQET